MGGVKRVKTELDEAGETGDAQTWQGLVGY